MKNAIIMFVMVYSQTTLLLGQAACKDAFRPNITNPTNSDTKEHINGDHHITSLFTSACIYQSSKPSPTKYCDVTSATNASVTPFESGDTTPILHSHFIGSDAKSGQALGVNGATATSGGLTAGAVVDCILNCAIELTISGSNDGLGLSVKFPQSPLWTQTATATSMSCGAVLDPALLPPGGGGGGGCTPNPNNPSATAPLSQGPTGQIMARQQDPGNPDPPCTISPIVIDTEGEGFQLTSFDDGVKFDMEGNGHPFKLSWTKAGSRNAFLALDRDGSGTITSGKELFGDWTPQPKSHSPNGFLALAEFDKPENGGNGDGVIDEHDVVFSKLRLWIDGNHDGISQPGEIHTLPEFGIHSLSLSYFDSSKTDEFGNNFRYRARINPRKEHRDHRDQKQSGEVGRWAYDVFFVTR